MEVEADGHVVGELEGGDLARSRCGFYDLGEVAEAERGLGWFFGLEVEEGVGAFLEFYEGAHEVTGGVEDEFFGVGFNSYVVADELGVFDGLAEAFGGGFRCDLEGDLRGGDFFFLGFEGGHVERAGVAAGDGDSQFGRFRCEGEFDGFVLAGSSEEFEEFGDVDAHFLSFVALVFVEDGFGPLEIYHGDARGVHGAEVDGVGGEVEGRFVHNDRYGLAHVLEKLCVTYLSLEHG